MIYYLGFTVFPTFQTNFHMKHKFIKRRNNINNATLLAQIRIIGAEESQLRRQSDNTDIKKKTDS